MVKQFRTFLILCLALAAGPALLAQDDAFRVGEFEVTEVVDGDTIAVDGLDRTIRFLCIDTEECEKGSGAKERTDALRVDFAKHAQAQVRVDPLGQFKTPMGWEGKKFAEAWFPLGTRVRVEHDSMARKTGYYSRILGYVFVQRNEQWVNYNVECVRAGMSPYFDKYGRSERFEADFIAAEREARIHQRGIWSPHAMSYPNYDERMACWNRRAKTLSQFEARYGPKENAFNLLDEDDWKRLPTHVGEEVILLGTVQTVNRKAEPPILETHHKELDRLALVVPDLLTLELVRRFLDTLPEDFFCFRGTLAPPLEAGGRTYAFHLALSDAQQVFLEIPGLEPSVRHPEKALPLTAERIHWKEAPRFMGKEVQAVGRVIRTENIGSITFINFDKDYRNTLTVVIKKAFYDQFPEPPAAMYKNRTLLIRGKVTEHKGAPQIEVTGPGQIEILE